MCELFKRIHEQGVLLGLVDNELREYIRSEKLLEWQRIQEADKLKYDAEVISKKLALEEMKLVAEAEGRKLAAAAEQSRLAAEAEDRKLAAAAEQNRLAAEVEERKLTMRTELERQNQDLTSQTEAAFRRPCTKVARIASH